MNIEITSNAASFESLTVITLIALIALLGGRLLGRLIPVRISLSMPVILSLVLCTGLLLYRVAVEEYLVADEVRWHLRAVGVADYLNGRVDSVNSFSSGKEGYAWLIGLLYTVSGNVPLVPIVLGIVLMALTVVVAAALAGCASSQLGLASEPTVIAQRVAAYFTALCPIIWIWAPRVLRETLMMFLIGMAVLFFVRYLDARRMLYLVGVLTSVGLMASVRSGVGLGVAAAFALSGIVVWAYRFRSRVIRVLVVAVPATLLFQAVWSFQNADGELDVQGALRVSNSLNNATSAFGGAETYQQVDNIADLLLINLPRVAFGPFPLELDASPVMLLAAVCNFFWIICIAYAASILLPTNRSVDERSGRRSRFINTRTAVVLVILTGTLVAVMSITLANYGIVARMRLMPFIALIPLAAVGYAMSAERKRIKHTRPGLRAVR